MNDHLVIKVDDSKFTYEQFIKKMELYISVSKTFMQISSGGLAFSVIFVEKILKDSFGTLSIWLLLFWFFMGATVISGAIYQYLAVKCIENRYKIGFKVNNTLLPSIFVSNPGIVFGTVLGTFISGIISFLIFAAYSIIV